MSVRKNEKILYGRLRSLIPVCRKRGDKWGVWGLGHVWDEFHANRAQSTEYLINSLTLIRKNR